MIISGNINSLKNIKHNEPTLIKGKNMYFINNKNKNSSKKVLFELVKELFDRLNSFRPT